jgi:hypothetical protein
MTASFFSVLGDAGMPQSTDQCPFGRSCRENSEVRCRFQPAAGGQVLFVDDLKRPECSYALHFGAAWICQCPEANGRPHK